VTQPISSTANDGLGEIIRPSPNGRERFVDPALQPNRQDARMGKHAVVRVDPAPPRELRMPCGPHACRRPGPTCVLSRLGNAKAPYRVSATVPMMLDNSGRWIRRPPCRSSLRKTARLVSQVPVRWTSLTRFQSAGSARSTFRKHRTPARRPGRSGTPTLAGLCPSRSDTASGSPDVGRPIVAVRGDPT